MTKRVHSLVAALATVLVCSAAGAQMRGGVSSIRVPPMRVAPSARAFAAIPHAVQQVRVIRISPAGRATSSFSSFANSVSFGGTNGVPGLGFDYPHLAAISGAFRGGRSSNFGRGTHRGQMPFVPILVGGFPYYYSDFYAETSDYVQPLPQPQQQPQVIVIEQPAPAIYPAVNNGNDTAAASASPRPPVEPVRDVGEFVLVQRDGRILFASAFMVAGTQVAYVTPEGIRHTLPLAELDADATRQMNEARGTTLEIHN
jgi:hypothetical protein